MKLNKYIVNLVLIAFILLNLSFSRSAEQITQELQIEEALKEKVEMAIGNLFNSNDQFVVIVNATMREKPMSMGSETNTQTGENSSSSFSVIPGMPTIPQKISSQAPNSVISYSQDKFLLYHLKITVYLESGLASMGKLQTNIDKLIKESIPDIQDCSDCIFFESMNFESSASTSSDIQELKDKIEQLESEKKDAEDQIINWKFDQLEQTLAESQEQLLKYQEDELAHKKYIRQLDSMRLAKAYEIEKLYDQKRDSLLHITAVKLDEEQASRKEHDKEIIEDLLGKMGDEPKSNISNNNSGFPKWLLWSLIGVSFVVLVIIIILLAIKKRKPIYLKPKNTNTVNTQDAPQTLVGGTSVSQANQNSDVKLAELNSIRQSAVTMSVGQKEGATQIVQDWLEDGQADTQNDEESHENE